MDSLKAPKFKSKVEQFYYENRASELDLTNQEVFSDTESPKQINEQKKISEARRRAYSGDGRKSYFTFENGDFRDSEFEKHGSNMTVHPLSSFVKTLSLAKVDSCNLWFISKINTHCT